MTLLLTFYFLFYLLRDRDSIIDAIRPHLPLSQDEFDRVGSRVVDTIFATVFGTAVVAALQGGLGGLMFWWLGLPAPVFWSMLMALLAIVPFLGAFVVWAPAAGLLLLKGDYTSALVLTAWGSIVVGLVDNLVVYPEQMRRNLDATHGLYSSQRVLLALTEAGLPRQTAYELVQRHAMRAWTEGVQLLELLRADPEVRERLEPAALEQGAAG